MNDDEILQRIEEDAQRKRARVKDMLVDAGRQDLADDLARKYREIDLGLSGARGAWNALSAAQKKVLADMGRYGLPLKRTADSNQFMITLKNGMTYRACNLPTARNLCARELIACEGGVFEPESKFVITERGRFVLKYGPENAKTTADP